MQPRAKFGNAIEVDVLHENLQNVTTPVPESLIKPMTMFYASLQMMTFLQISRFINELLNVFGL